MARDGSFVIKIAAIDAASATFDKLNKRIAGMQAPFKRLDAQITKFGKLSGLSKIGDAIKGVANAALSAATSVARLGTQILQLAGATSIAGLALLVNKWGEWGNNLKITSLWLGKTTEQVQAMRNLSELSGAAADSMEKAVDAMQDMRRAAKQGDSGKAYFLLQMGVKASDTDEQAVEKIMDRARDKFRNGLQATAKAIMREGGISPDLDKYAFASDSARGKMKAEADANAKRSDKMAQASERFNKAQRSLTQTLQSILYSALTPLMEAGEGYLQQAETWISKTENQNWLMIKIKETTIQVKDAFAKAWPVVKELFSWVEWGIDKVGGVQNAFLLLMGLEIVTWAAGVTTGLVAMGTAVGLIFTPAFLAGIVAITAALAAYQAYKGGKKTASAADLGYGPSSAPGSIDDFGNPTLYENKATGDRKTALEMDDMLKERQAEIDAAEGEKTQTRAKRAGTPDAPLLDRPGSSPRGLRNNNPGNLMFAGQTGAIGKDSGGFAVFGDMDQGVAAMGTQLGLYADRDKSDTLSSIISKWAPPGSNDTAGYINYVARQTGYDPNAHLDLHDPAVLAKLETAMIRREEGDTRETQNVIDINVNHSNPPPGTTVGVATKGSILGTPKVETAMPQWNRG